MHSPCRPHHQARNLGHSAHSTFGRSCHKEQCQPENSRKRHSCGRISCTCRWGGRKGSCSRRCAGASGCGGGWGWGCPASGMMRGPATLQHWCCISACARTHTPHNQTHTRTYAHTHTATHPLPLPPPHPTPARSPHAAPPLCPAPPCLLPAPHQPPGRGHAASGGLWCRAHACM